MEELNEIKGGKPIKKLSKKFFKYAVEIVVIIFSISVSFFIDRKKEKNNDRDLEQIYLNNLIEDIDQDITMLDSAIGKSESTIECSKWMIALIENEKRSENVVEFSKNFNCFLNRTKFLPSNATFEDLNSGNMRVLSYPQLRREIFKYYYSINAVLDDQRSEEVSQIHLLQTFLYTHFYMKDFDKGKNLIFPNNQNWGIINSPMFANVANSRLLQRQVLLRKYKDLRSNALNLKSTLKTSLDE